MDRSRLPLTAEYQRPLPVPPPEAGLQQWLCAALAGLPPAGGKSASEQDRFMDLPARPINPPKTIEISVSLGYGSPCLIIKKEHQ